MGEPTKQHDATELGAGYSAGHRLYELCGMTLATACLCWLVSMLAKAPMLSGWWMPLACFAGILIADFTSGFVHWMFDSWGGLDTPVVGKLAIRTFRHHHVDAKAITTHDFIETNGHNITLTVLYSTYAFLFFFRGGKVSPSDVFWGTALVCATFFTGFTSQIHKWAHMDSPPRIVMMLQRARIILHPDHHNVHHGAPYNRNYCITVGWLNGPLRAIRFFETLERTITAVTGVVPREDDLGETAAIEVAAENGTLAPPLGAEETKKVS